MVAITCETNAPDGLGACRKSRMSEKFWQEAVGNIELARVEMKGDVRKQLNCLHNFNIKYIVATFIVCRNFFRVHVRQKTH